MRVGDRIKLLREKKGWNQRELARRSRVDHTWIFRLESGERNNISLEAAKRLARALGVTLDYLAGMYEEDDGSLWPPSADEACRLPVLVSQMHEEIASAVF
jgi:transcriptional regulator with XRE-family HTH domain